MKSCVDNKRPKYFNGNSPKPILGKKAQIEEGKPTMPVFEV
jgi:hypothetical protein